ncbi:tyrosine-type recombinase/integrase [Polaromonas sp.]|uniref:tyrosine-type recombinase/integrase n=1 Tax=Polaromonas sp. TaxID=1869339 RepID=UPI00352B2798
MAGHISTYPSALVPQPEAMDDEKVLALWLSGFTRRSKATARNYRTQAMKFRLFLQLIHPDWPRNTHLQRATQKDVENFEAALTLKDLGADERRLVQLSPGELTLFGLKEQPFGKPMATSSVNQALAVLNAMYSFMREPSQQMPAPYVIYNPVRIVRKSVSRAVTQTDRYIPLDGIQAMHGMALVLINEATGTQDAQKILEYERLLWMFTLLFGLWGRREEICQISMGDFKQANDDGWRVYLKRKGKRDAESIPASKWVIEGLMRYRESLGLTRAWGIGDLRPAIGTLRKRPGLAELDHINAQTIYLQIKNLASKTAAAVESGKMLPEITDDRRGRLTTILRSCSPHWFRHSGPTIAINTKTITIENASKILGHSTLATTSQMYYHGDQDAMRSALDGMSALLNPTTR